MSGPGTHSQSAKARHEPGIQLGRSTKKLVSFRLFVSSNENQVGSAMEGGGGHLHSRVYGPLHFLNGSLLIHSSAFFPFINVASFPGHFMEPCVFLLRP